MAMMALEKTKAVVKINQVDYQYVRKKVYEIHLEKKKRPTVRTVLAALQNDENIKFEGDKESLRKILIQLGFVYHKVQKRRTRLMGEKGKVIIMRGEYVRGIQKQREEGKYIVYADGKIISTGGGKMILFHAGDENGFLPKVLMVCNADSDSQIRKETFEKWLDEYLIPNLRPASVLVVNDHLFKKTLIEKVEFQNKDEMVAYITENNVRINIDLDTAHVYQLYEPLKHHLNFNKPYTINKIMKKHGHTALRIPKYHLNFNIAQAMWKKVIGTSEKQLLSPLTSAEEVKKVLIEKYAEIPTQDWVQAIENAKESELEIADLYGKIDDYFDEFRIREKDGSLKEESYSEEDEDTGDNTESE